MPESVGHETLRITWIILWRTYEKASMPISFLEVLIIVLLFNTSRRFGKPIYIDKLAFTWGVVADSRSAETSGKTTTTNFCTRHCHFGGGKDLGKQGDISDAHTQFTYVQGS
jgi:tetrahydromethanopterin S-methyltransferase subunit E